MSYVCDISYLSMNKADKFDDSLQQLSSFSKVLSHPARLAILKYLAEARSCISGDISDYLPLSRTTVSQHLKELRNAGLIQGEIDGLKINYCLNPEVIGKYCTLFEKFFIEIKKSEIIC
jgi:ArsR family transcriptional regulator, arsenate/arsenite/antimonite-responsive transcriptional repressor